MPYRSIQDLPESVLDHVPKHAQEIYKEAFNSAWDQYADPDDRHRVAWAAVKEKYEKGEDGDWHARR